jgi:hypothetical protein
VIMKAARSVNHRSLRPSQELLAVGHKSTRVQKAANKRKRHLRKSTSQKPPQHAFFASMLKTRGRR